MTDEITTCQVINKNNNLFMTLFTEWLDSGLKITIFTENATPLIGQMTLANADSFAENLSKTRAEYVDLTRKILSGKDSSVEFILKDLKLRWKKGAWNHGIIDMTESRIELEFPEFVKKILRRDSELEKTLDEVKRENEELRNAQRGQNDKLERIISLKNELEDNLYKRFLVVLNLKKEKIRELQNQLDDRNGNDKKSRDEIYEADTDPSEDEEEEQEEEEEEKGDKTEKKKKNSGGRAQSSMYLSRAFNDIEMCDGEKLLKRQISDSDGKMIDSDYEEDCDRIKRNCKYAKGGGGCKSQRSKSGEFNPARASTSKNGMKIDKADKKERNSRKVRSLQNFENGESEEDIFADDS